MEYSMKVYPIHFDDCRTEWCVEYPNLKANYIKFKYFL